MSNDKPKPPAGKGQAIASPSASAVKGPPLLFVAYFVVRRRFDLAAIVLAVACAVNLLPDLIAHAPDSGLWVLTWVNRYVIPTQGWDAKLGIWGTAPVFNQSLAGTFGRIGENLNPHAVKAAAYLLLLAMGVTSLAVAARVASGGRHAMYVQSLNLGSSGAETGAPGFGRML